MVEKTSAEPSKDVAPQSEQEQESSSEPTAKQTFEEMKKAHYTKQNAKLKEDKEETEKELQAAAGGTE
jgi:hypothetical protein